MQFPTADSVVVVWETDHPMPGEVHFGRSGAYDHQVQSEVIATRHEVTLRGLDPGSEYGYWIASLGYALGGSGSFRTAPSPGETAFAFAAFGDSRTGHATHRRIADRILSFSPDFALHTGDLVGFGSRTSEWDRFFEIEHSLLASVPLFPSPGNHEENDARYFEAFVLPGNERWYAFDWGNARFVSLQIDAIVPFGKESEQVQWLESVLAANRQPWLVVWFHLPPFDATARTDLSAAVRVNLVPLFEQYGVDLVLNGHSHSYQRSIVNGITYVVTGGGGAELHPLVESGPGLQTAFAGHHFVYFTVNGPTLTAQVVADDGQIVEEFGLESGG